jgi:hypothetical protein
MSIEQHVTIDDAWFTNSDHDFEFEIVQDDGTAQPVSGWNFVFLLKRNKKDPDSAAALRLETGVSPAQIAITDGPGGVVTVSVLKANSATLRAGLYYFELKRTDDGERSPVTHGTAILQQSLDQA